MLGRISFYMCIIVSKSKCKLKKDTSLHTVGNTICIKSQLKYKFSFISITSSPIQEFVVVNLPTFPAAKAKRRHFDAFVRNKNCVKNTLDLAQLSAPRVTPSGFGSPLAPQNGFCDQERTVLSCVLFCVRAKLSTMLRLSNFFLTWPKLRWGSLSRAGLADREKTLSHTHFVCRGPTHTRTLSLKRQQTSFFLTFSFKAGHRLESRVK